MAAGQQLGMGLAAAFACLMNLEVSYKSLIGSAARALVSVMARGLLRADASLLRLASDAGCCRLRCLLSWLSEFVQVSCSAQQAPAQPVFLASDHRNDLASCTGCAPVISTRSTQA